MSQRVSSDAVPSQGSLATIAAFVVGLPLSVAVLWLIQSGPWQDPELLRYTSHPVEKAEIVLFCCAITALIVKGFTFLRDRVVFARSLLPKWEGKPQSPAQAASLINHLDRQSGWRGTWLGNRLMAILDFVHARGSANELDDQLRTLSDNDIMAQEGSYSLLRFINWAIPILGFLGTVVGITEAIKGVTPEQLEHSMNGVTDGLATAFDTTAVALLLTMALMFGTFICERLEQSVLDRVDGYVEKNLAHRFERTGAESTQFIEALRQNTQVLLGSTEQLVNRQAEVWSKSLEKADRHWAEAAKTQQTQITQAIGHALEFALTRHGERLAEMENKLIARNQSMLEGVGKLAQALGDTSKQHREALAEIAGRLGAQTETLARVQEGEANLIRLQETLQTNLSALANTGTFEEAVQSLTAAIHLLTTRVQPAPTLKKAA